jgi:hypothetical protein
VCGYTCSHLYQDSSWEAIAWRCKLRRSFYLSLTSILRQQMRYAEAIWKYALMWQDPLGLKEWLRAHSSDIARVVAPPLQTTFLQVLVCPFDVNHIRPGESMFMELSGFSLQGHAASPLLCRVSCTISYVASNMRKPCASITEAVTVSTRKVRYLSFSVAGSTRLKLGVAVRILAAGQS